MSRPQLRGENALPYPIHVIAASSPHHRRAIVVPRNHRRFHSPTFHRNHRRRNHNTPPLRTKSPFHGEVSSTNRDLIRKNTNTLTTLLFTNLRSSEINLADLRTDENINRLQSILQVQLSCKKNHRSFGRRGSEIEENKVVDPTEPGKQPGFQPAIMML